MKRAATHRFSRPLVQYRHVPSVQPSHGTPTRSPVSVDALGDDLVAEDAAASASPPTSPSTHVQIGPADPAGAHLQQHLPGARLGHRQVGESQGRLRAVQDHRAHRPIFYPQRRDVRSYRRF